MNVDELIKVLEKNVKPEDRKNSEIEVWHDKIQYEIYSISKFNILTDILFHIKPVDSPIIKPAKIQKKHNNKINDIKNKIIK